jgi:hypothetical protein
MDQRSQNKNDEAKTTALLEADGQQFAEQSDAEPTTDSLLLAMPNNQCLASSYKRTRQQRVAFNDCDAALQLIFGS